VTFKDGSTTLGTATLNGSGQASLTTSSLTLGTHSITASYAANGNFAASTSAPLSQVVNTPVDSIKLHDLQVLVPVIEAQSSGQTISGAIDTAIGDAFSDGGSAPVTSGPGGVRFNFAAEPQGRSDVSAASAMRSPLSPTPACRPRRRRSVRSSNATGWLGPRSAAPAGTPT
jgi:hypothetical protein